MKEKYEIKTPTVQMFQICNQQGENINQDLISPKLKKENLLKAYELMKFSRIMDEISLQYQRQGRMLTPPPSMGQEAIQVAIALNMAPTKDWLVLGYRFQAMALGLGKPFYNLICYWLGNEKGSKKVNSLNILPLNVLIGTQISHAAGVALAEKYKKLGAFFFQILVMGELVKVNFLLVWIEPLFINYL